MLSLDDSLHIAALSREQQTRLAVKVPEARTAFSAWLRFYASLTAAERRAAHSKGGVPFWRIPEPKRLLIVREGSEGPLGGNPVYEQIIYEPAAILRAALESNVEILYGIGKHVFPSVLTIRLEPVKDLKGPVRLQGQVAHVVLPFRAVAAAAKGDGR